MEKIKTIKAVSRFATSIGVGTIVGNGIKLANSAGTLNPITKVCVFVADIAISGLISEKACNYMDKQIDEVANLFKEFKEKEAEEDGES